MLEISNKTNLLEQKSYKYSLQDVAEPNLHRDVYSYGTIPKVAFNHRRVPMSMPEEIWITDTSLRDGQQSVEPYSVDQIVNIYKLLSRHCKNISITRVTYHYKSTIIILCIWFILCPQKLIHNNFFNSLL